MARAHTETTFVSATYLLLVNIQPKESHGAVVLGILLSMLRTSGMQ
jgi:hypothetical protein